MITLERANECMRLLKQLPKSAAYQPVILPVGACVKSGHDRSNVLHIILGKEPGNSFLDIGCNVGHLCYLARKAGMRRVEGVEHDEKICEVTRIVGEAWGFTVRCSTLQDYKPGRFDTVALLSVLHHRIDDPAGMVEKYAINTNKRLVLELPITHKPGFASPAELKYSYWRWLFNPDDAAKLLTKLGFKHVEQHPSFDAYHGKISRRFIIGVR